MSRCCDYLCVHAASEYLCVVFTHLNAVQERSELRADERTPSIRRINVHPHVFFITWTKQETQVLSVRKTITLIMSNEIKKKAFSEKYQTISSSKEF